MGGGGNEVLRPEAHAVDHDVGQGVASPSPASQTLGVVLHLVVPGFG